jgi:hypothetical protein
MVFRSLYHFSAAILRSEAADVVSYFVERQKLFGLVKYRCKRQSLDGTYTQQIWALTS